MAAALRRRRQRGEVNYWPGFVDALSTLLLAITFLLSVFAVAQTVLSQEVSGRDDALARLARRVSELTDLLALERGGRGRAEAELGSVQANLDATRREEARLQGLVAGAGAAAGAASGREAALASAAEAERATSARALAQVETLNAQVAALRRQLAALEDALQASESQGREAQGRIADLGSRLNVALAQRVQELARYRSDFFGRLRGVLGNRSDIRVVGDRFVFQSELFFEGGAAELKAEARPELDKLVAVLGSVEREIPPDLAWVLRVDGHTDRRPLSGLGRYRSNWELSSARAIAVVEYLVRAGVPANRLVAAGFAENQPLELGDGEEAFRRNRRIELKFTER